MCLRKTETRRFPTPFGMTERGMRNSSFVIVPFIRKIITIIDSYLFIVNKNSCGAQGLQAWVKVQQYLLSFYVCGFSLLPNRNSSTWPKHSYIRVVET